MKKLLASRAAAALITTLILSLLAALAAGLLSRASAQPAGGIAIATDRLLYSPDDEVNFDIKVDSGGRNLSGSLVLKVYPQAPPLAVDAFVTQPIFETVINDGFSVTGQAAAAYQAKTGDLKAGEGGYPVKVSLLQNGSEVLAGTAWLAVVSGEGREPLDLVMLWTASSPPQKDAQDKFIDMSLLDRCRANEPPGDSLLQHLELAQKYPQLKTSYAIEPAMLDEITDMSDGFELVAEGNVKSFDGSSAEARTASGCLDNLRLLAGAPNAEVISAPYSYVSLPVLAKQGWDDGDGQFRIGHDVLGQALGLAEVPEGTYAPGLDVTTDSLRYLAETGGEHVVLSGGSRASVQARDLAGAVNYRLRDLGGERITAFFANDDASWWLLGSQPDPNAFFAALVNSYISGDPNRLVIAASPVATPAISSGARDAVYAQLGGLGWVRSMTLGEARQKYRPDSLPATLLRYEDPLSGYVGQTYYARLDAVHSRFEDYRQAVDNDEPELARLARKMYTAENAYWLSNDASPEDANRGLEYLAAIDGFIDTELGRLQVSLDTPWLQRSTDGEATVTITNDNLYAFTVDVVVEGNEGVSFPEGSERKLRLENGQTQFTVPYSSEGWSRLTARVTSRGNTLVEDGASIHPTAGRVWLALLIVLTGIGTGLAYIFLVVRRR